ncbi:hypothetical protein BJV82DRAFT_636558 [Fennellomyces sp. T-0311]|nr:hypothetical protein BJV82DRAFT_636558 [Fennellomyces sp. T-0311]
MGDNYLGALLNSTFTKGVLSYWLIVLRLLAACLMACRTSASKFNNSNFDFQSLSVMLAGGHFVHCVGPPLLNRALSGSLWFCLRLKVNGPSVEVK